MTSSSSLYGTATTQNVNSTNSTSLYGEAGTPVPDASGNLIVRGDLWVLSGNILTTATTGNIFPANATTINLGLAATAMNIGASTGVTTVNNQLSTANYAFPVADGTAGQVLTTNGAGDLSFTNSGNVGRTYAIDATAVSGGANFNLVGSDATVDTIKFASGTGITVNRDDANTITITNSNPGGTGVTSIAGTTNQVIASASTGAVTLSLPQNINTGATPTFAGATLGNTTVGVATDNTISTTSGNLVLDAFTGIVSATTIQAPVGGAGPLGGLNLYSNDATNAIHIYDNFVQIVSGTIPGADWVFNEDGSTDFPSYKFPYADGTANQVLRTNGAGVLSFYTPVDTNTTYTYTAGSTTGGANLTLTGSDATTNTVKLTNAGHITAVQTSATAVTLGSDATNANTASTIVARDASGNFSAGTITATLSGTATQVSNSLTAGTHLSGGPFNGSSAVTLTTDATNANTASTIVARDASGNFSAGTITAALNGNATTATTAAKVANALTAGTHLSGGPFDGSAAVTLTTDATSANTASTIVSRDAGGEFSAGGATLGVVTVGVGSDNLITTTSGDLQLDSFTGNIFIDNATFTTGSGNAFIFNDAVTTTVDAFKSATSITMGATTGTTTIRNNLAATTVKGGNITVGTDTAQTISTTSGNLVLQTAAGVNAGTMTLTAGANGAITLAPNGTGSVANTFSNGGNLTNTRNYVFGAIRNATTASIGDMWALNATGTLQPFRGVSLDNSADTTKNAGYLARNYASTAGGRSRLIFERARGTAASPTAVQSGDFLGEVDVTGYTSTGWLSDNIITGGGVPGFFGFTAAENWVSNTAIGTAFGLSLAPTSTTITSAANLIPVLALTPQTAAYRADTHSFSAGKSGTYGMMDLNGNRANFTLPIKFAAFLATAVNGTLATTAATGTGSVATLTFGALASAPFTVGSQVIVAGVTPTAYNGTVTVTACNTTSVSYTSTATGAQTVAGTVKVAGSVGWQIAISDSPVNGGKMAYWDTTNSRFSYIDTNLAV